MADQQRVPGDPLAFIGQCIAGRRIFWTYHVNMRMGQSPITRTLILGAVNSFEVIEQYPEDKYLPSYLIRAEHEGLIFHVLIATDVFANNSRMPIDLAHKPAWMPSFE
jgi:hypothetical protein